MDTKSSPASSETREPVLALFFLALFIRLIYVSLNPPDLVSLDAYFNTIGWNLAQGLGFTLGGKPTFMVGPVYPGFIALIYKVMGQNPLAVAYVQAALDALSAVLVLEVAGIFWTRPVPLLASLLYSFYPAFWTFARRLRMETMLIFCLLVFTLAFLSALRSGKAGTFLFAGMVLGFSTLLKPFTLLVPVWIIPILWWNVADKKKAIMGWGSLTAGFLVLLLPWTFYNTQRAHRFIPVATGLGLNLWTGTYEPWDGSYPMPGNDERPLWNAVGGPMPYNYVPEVDARMKRIAFQRWVDRPWAEAVMGLRKMVYFWVGNKYYLFGPEGKLLPALREDVRGRGVIAAAYSLFKRLLFFPALFALALVGAWRTRQRWRSLSPLYLFPLYFTALHGVLSVESGRYNIPVLPYVFIFTVVGVMP